MKKIAKVTVVFLLALLFLLVGATIFLMQTTDENQNGQKDELWDTVPLTVVDVAPQNVPNIRIEDRELEPLFYQWYNTATGEIDLKVPPEHAKVNSYPYIHGDERIVFTVSSSVKPAVVNIRYFYYIGDDGFPADTDDSRIECISELDTCGIDVGDTNVHVWATLDAHARFVVIEIFYYNVDEARDFPYSIVSYGFNIEGSRY